MDCGNGLGTPTNSHLWALPLSDWFRHGVAISWFHEYVVPFADVELFVKRLKFNGADSKGFAAHFSNMVCVWPWYASIDPDGVGPSIRVSTRF